MQNKSRENSENNFIGLLNFIADPAVIVDAKGRILLVNNALEDITGLNAKEVIGKIFLEVGILTAESKAILLENLKKRMQCLPIQPYEITFSGKDGEIRYFEVKAKKISYNRQPADLVIFRDITRRKKNLAKLKEYAEKMEALVNEKVKEIKENAQKLRESEEKYRTQFEEALDAIVVADAETGIIIDCNRAASELVGREKSELIGKHQRILHPPEEIIGDFSRTFKQHLKEKEGQILETQVITKKGEIKDVAIKANIFEFQGKKMLQGVFRDITEQKKAEMALRLSEEKYRELINGMNDTAWVIDFDAKFIDVNDTAVKVLGYSREELLSMGPSNIDSSLSKEQIKDLVKRMPADQIQVFETSHTTKDGKKIPVEISSSLVTYQGKKAVLSIARNITERKKAEKKLEEYSQNLEKLVAKRTKELEQTQAKLLKAEKLAVIGELAGMVGHDLRNPLTGIKGAAYYLKTKYAAEIDDTGKEMLETIDKAIEHSNKIINDLLAYSSKLSLELSETTPKLLLKNALALIEVPERIRIIDNTKGKPKIKADIENMRKVFINLIANAIDAMPGAGTLTITSKAAKSNVKIIFKDTGTGMTEETLSKLKLGFPLFTTKAKGMGFGLPICKRIVEAHGGKISLKSTFGKGTAVTMTIPVNPKPVKKGEEKWIFKASALQALHAAQERP
jgi:PAS domain S-box-containing protein